MWEEDPEKHGQKLEENRRLSSVDAVKKGGAYMGRKGGGGLKCTLEKEKSAKRNKTG